MKSACVTGATGYVASELIRQLLSRGYAVKATVRCQPDNLRLQYLRDLADSYSGSLQLVQVQNLLEASEALDTALAGSEYVFHVASPFRFDGDPNLDIVQPAVRGTQTLLEAAAKHKPSVKRVIVTSSVCAIHDMNRKQQPKHEQYCEEDWNEVSTIDTEAYWVSKVQAERVAWQLAEQLGLDIITILPNFVLGPVISSQQAGSVSVGFMTGILESPAGREFTGSWTVNDVRDVAAAHILAAENPKAHGRYIVSQPKSISARFITDSLKAAWPAAASAMPDGADEPTTHINSSKIVQELGLQLTPVADTIRDMAESLVKHGIAKPTWLTAPA
eukprot:GHRR01011979.1.p1 GENE.GHRR01011979.1~~GHRR01011979.1.p1  ORF type:complete len:332 (+),score=113.60 GHRR01011979.1:492-1487(+)